MTPAEARALFPVLERTAYLNAGTFGPLARPTLDAMQAELQADGERGRSGQEYFERVLDLRAQARARLAGLVGAEAEQVALTGSTTDACNIVLAGLDLGPEDEVVTTADEHFGLLGPLHASGAQVVVAEPDADAILAAVTPRTRLLAVSQVLWTSGRVLPVRELRAETGVPVLVDGAQSVGAIPVDAAGLDFLTISGQKWLCGPDATGALVVADPERLRVARPSYFSQASLRARRSVRAARGRGPLRAELDLGERAGRAARGARRPAGVVVRARRGAGAPLPRAARAARRARPRRRDARVVPLGGADGARHAPRRGGRRRPRAPGPQPRPRVGRLVDERRRPRAPRRSVVGGLQSGKARATLARGRPRRAGVRGKGSAGASSRCSRRRPRDAALRRLRAAAPARASRSSSASRRTCRRRSAQPP